MTAPKAPAYIPADTLPSPTNPEITDENVVHDAVKSLFDSCGQVVAANEEQTIHVIDGPDYRVRFQNGDLLSVTRR